MARFVRHIKRDGRRIGARLRAHKIDACALCPDRQLLDRFAEQAREILGQNPHVKSVYTTIGGGAAGSDPFTPQGLGEVRKATLTINLTAPVLLTHGLLPLLQRAPEAAVINVGSAFGALGHPGFTTYCASKFALRAGPLYANFAPDRELFIKV